MPATTLHVNKTLERLLHRASVDTEFRNELYTHPELFGVSSDTFIPLSVKEQDQTLIASLNAALTEFDIVAQCGSTCSFGPLTIVCDGTTK